MKMRCLAGLVVLVAESAAAADTITVCQDGCDYTSINEAIEAASDGDTIQLHAETYFEGTFIRTNGKAITIKGSIDDEGNPTTKLDGENSLIVIICADGESEKTSFQNLVIQNGYGQIFGNGDIYAGGMIIFNSSPVISNCVFKNNVGGSVFSGGALWCEEGSPQIIDCTFIANRSELEGGAMTITTSTVPSIVEITNSLFMGNTSIQSGGAIRIASEECAVTLSGCRISSNSSLAGGAIHCSSSNMTIENCVFENNIADIGSGIYIDSNQALLSECEFRGHQEALHCNGTGSGSVDIANCNFTENGIKSPYVVFLQTGSVATISGTTFCDNQATWDIYGAWADLGGNCIASSCSECDQDNCDADINNDGIVDGADLNILLGAWGVCP